MNLYIVVHHPQDPVQNWANSWLDEMRLGSITTTREIGKYCFEAMKNGERVFVHRCSWGIIQHTICCSVKVIRVDIIDKASSLVWFSEPQVLGTPPPVTPYPGQNFYWA
jgi:hypothetical protein